MCVCVCMCVVCVCVCVVCVCVLSCPTLCNPLDCSPPGSSVHGNFQARIMEGLPFPTPGHLPDSGIEGVSCSGRQILYTGPPGKLGLRYMSVFHGVSGDIFNAKRD